jgi:hypothetical protein
MAAEIQRGEFARKVLAILSQNIYIEKPFGQMKIMPELSVPMK